MQRDGRAFYSRFLGQRYTPSRDNFYASLTDAGDMVEKEFKEKQFTEKQFAEKQFTEKQFT